MTNKEILQCLSNKRDVTNFSKYVGISKRQVYNLLRSEKTQHSQYLNFIRFVLDKYKTK